MNQRLLGIIVAVAVLVLLLRPHDAVVPLPATRSDKASHQGLVVHAQPADLSGDRQPSNSGALQEGAGYAIRILGEGSGPLEGARVEAQPALLRSRDGPGVLVGSSNHDGTVSIDAGSLASATLLAIYHENYVAAAVPLGELVRGKSSDVTLRLACRYECVVSDPRGSPLEGVMVVLSKKSVLTSSGMFRARASDPGPQVDSAFFCGKTDKEGRASIRGMLPGPYYCCAYAAGMLPIEGLAGSVDVPSEKAHAITMGYIYAAVVAIEGDEVIAFNASWACAPMASGSTEVMLAPDRESLKQRFPGSVQIVGVPSMGSQFDGRDIPIEMVAYGRKSGWAAFPVSLVPLSRVAMVSRRMVAQVQDLTGTVEAVESSPSGVAMPTGQPFLWLIGQDPDPLRQARFPLVCNGGGVSVPIGTYTVVCANPFFRLDPGVETIAIAPGGRVEIRGRFIGSMTWVEPQICLDPREEALVYGMMIADVESDTRWTLPSMVRGHRIALPAGRSLVITAAVMGWPKQEQTVSLERRDGECQRLRINMGWQ